MQQWEEEGSPRLRSHPQSLAPVPASLGSRARATEAAPQSRGGGRGLGCPRCPGPLLAHLDPAVISVLSPRADHQRAAGSLCQIRHVIQKLLIRAMSVQDTAKHRGGQEAGLRTAALGVDGGACVPSVLGPGPTLGFRHSPRAGEARGRLTEADHVPRSRRAGVMGGRAGAGPC